MRAKLLILLLLIPSLLISQSKYELWRKAEQDRFKKKFGLSKIQYPGDSNIDVIYYGLNITVIYFPANISGSVIVKVKAATSSINSCFLDLKNNLSIESILINGISTTFIHSNDKINIDLDRNYLKGETFSL